MRTRFSVDLAPSGQRISVGSTRASSRISEASRRTATESPSGRQAPAGMEAFRCRRFWRQTTDIATRHPVLKCTGTDTPFSATAD